MPVLETVDAGPYPYGLSEDETDIEAPPMAAEDEVEDSGDPPVDWEAPEPELADAGITGAEDELADAGATEVLLPYPEEVEPKPGPPEVSGDEPVD